MKGFFDPSEVVASGCQLCQLDRGCSSPKMPVGGKGKAGIMVIAEAPGASEDAEGTQLVGRAGQLLSSALRRSGISLHSDCWKTNAICCRPPDNRTPKPKEVEACRPNVVKAIAEKKPKVVVLLGTSAVESVIGSRWTKKLGSLERWRGWAIPDQEFGCWLCPTWHPSFILRGNEKGMVGKIWERDLLNAVRQAAVPFPVWKEPKIELSADAVKSIMRGPGPVSFDYEASGLKPDWPGHFIHCVGVANKTRTAAALLKDVRKETIAFLKSGIPKIGCNTKYENRWSEKLLKTRVRNWIWCGMLGAHIVDQRKSITSAKFQGYINFGVCGYELDMEPFLKSKTSNDMNRILDAPPEKLLYYCGMDARMEYDTALKQMEILA